MQLTTTKKFLKNNIKIPPDKSISHRSIMISSIANGVSTIHNFLMGDDCISTINCFRNMGVRIDVDGDTVQVHGVGMYGLTQPTSPLYVGNSGTTIRLMSGILSAQHFDSVITGDHSIQSRPMQRIITPLTQMGANIQSNNGKAPLHIQGSLINGISYALPVPSAQVKSCIILSALYANDTTTIYEPQPTRNHTELMINAFGGSVTRTNNYILVAPTNSLTATEFTIPSDISSVAFYIVYCLINKNCNYTFTNIGYNETRTGIITALLQMGANITISNIRKSGFESVCDINVQSSDLTGTTFDKSLVPLMIDEIPILVISALFATGTTTIKDASELKHKESNRINVLYTELSKLGCNIQETDDGLIINQSTSFNPATIDCHNDHRLAMCFAILGFSIDTPITINNFECISVSFPNFLDAFCQKI